MLAAGRDIGGRGADDLGIVPQAGAEQFDTVGQQLPLLTRVVIGRVVGDGRITGGAMAIVIALVVGGVLARSQGAVDQG